MKKTLAIAFVVFAALFILPFDWIVACAVVLVVIALMLGKFNSPAEPASSSMSLSVDGELPRLGNVFLPASMQAQSTRVEGDLSLR